MQNEPLPPLSLPTMALQPALAALAAIGQEHLLSFYSELPAAQQQALLAQVASIDLAGLPKLIDGYVKNKPAAAVSGSIDPVDAYALSGKRSASGAAWDRTAARQSGIALIGAGKVAAFTVAGGQGSRLGYDGPKGCYPAGAVTRKPLFAMLADWILAAQERFGKGNTIPWLIMTSPGNHRQTTEFFAANKHFGLRPQDVMFFPQGQLPSMEMGTGKILLAGPSEIALNPDGHGGSIKALYASGATKMLADRGIEQICYVQVDNPLVRVIDPLFLGLHAAAKDSSADMSSKFVAKTDPAEKVGLLCRVDGKTAVVEYSDAPVEMQARRNPDGSLVFSAGSIAIHVIARKFIERLNDGSGVSMPYHRAEKKVAFYDIARRTAVTPDKNNAIKLETFVFDALPLAASTAASGSITMETDRVDEFAPIKNADGNDSPATCSAIQTLRAARWLEAAGCAIPRKADGSPDCVLELSPRIAFDGDEVRSLVGTTLPRAIERGAVINLGSK
jgi:UDP-N-acetylglucosamine/UDP-N-acetylgalactosamine diphosphorylase